MAGEKLIGKISSLQGEGSVLIIRANGEQVIGNIGDEVFQGDTVVTSSNTVVQVTVDGIGIPGVIAIDQANAAKLDGILFDNVNSLIFDSSNESPVFVGQQASTDIINQFNAVFPDSGIVTANESSQTGLVVSEVFPLSDLPPPGAGDGPNPVASGFVSPFVSVDNTANIAPEVIPGSESDSSDIEPAYLGALFFDNTPLFIINNPDPFIPAPKLETGSSVFVESEVIALIPINPIGDTVSGQEDVTLSIDLLEDVLANDQVGGASVREIMISNGISISTTNIGPVIDPTTDPVDAALPPDIDIIDPAIPDDPADPAGDKSRGGIIEFIRGIFRNSEAGFEVDLGGGLLVRVVLVNGQGQMTTERGGTVTQDPTTGSFSYEPPDNFNGTDSFDYFVIGPAGYETGRATVTINVAAVNDAPENSAPNAITMDEDTTYSFIDNDLISINDIDSDSVTTVLSVSNGVLSVTDVNGVVTNNGTSTITLSGSISDVNTALASLTYQSNSNFNGSDTLSITTNDNHVTNPETDTDTIAITVTSVNDAPTTDIVVPAVVQNVGVNSVLNIGDVISIQDVDGNLSSVTLSVSNGTLTLTSSGGASISNNSTSAVTLTGTQDQINAASNLVYQGNLDYSGADALNLSFMDSAGATVMTELFDINVAD